MIRRPSAVRPTPRRSDRKNAKRATIARLANRSLHHETLEKRELLAAEVLAIRPDAGALLTQESVLQTPPREFNVFFNGSANLQEASVSGNVRLVRAGGDGTFGDGNEVDVSLGYVGLEQPGVDTIENRAKLVLRPASTAIHNATDPTASLPDDMYRIEVLAGLQSEEAGGDVAFNDGQDYAATFQIDRAAQVIGIVPQPVQRNSPTSLDHLVNRVDVYFDAQPLDTADAENVNFYRLINADTGELVTVPDTATYHATENRVELEFDPGDLSVGNYRLDVGSSQSDLLVEFEGVLTPADDNNSDFANATLINDTTADISEGIFRFTGEILPQTSVPQPTYPGGNDDPGHRSIQAQNHLKPGSGGAAGVPLSGVVGTGLDAPNINSNKFIAYQFPAQFPQNADGATYQNFITEEQKEITRGILEIYAELSGYEFAETADAGLLIGRGDLRASDPASDSGPGGILGLGSAVQIVLDFDDFDNVSTFGDAFTGTMFHEVGHALGLGHTYDLHATMGSNPIADVEPGEPDRVHLQRVAPPVSTDIDLFHFNLLSPGRVEIETFAERSGDITALNTQLRLFQQDPVTGRSIEVAGNVNYFGSDSALDLELPAGDYYVGVSSAGNDQYDPAVPDSGFGGTTFGQYELELRFKPDAVTGQELRDAQGTALDGDADGDAGGVHSFWFQATDTASTIFVDKVAGAGTGSLASPFNDVGDALAAADALPGRVAIPDLVATNYAELDGQVFTIDQGGVSHTFTFGTTGTNPIDLSGAASAAAAAGLIVAAIDAQAGVGTAVVSGDEVQVDSPAKIGLDGSPDLSLVPTIVRIVGNAVETGVAGALPADSPLNRELLDLTPYEIGFDANASVLSDGAEFRVPRGTTVMIEAGVLLKMRAANIDVGTVASTDTNRAGGAIQVLGTPSVPVFFRSHNDDTAGGETDGGSTGTPANNRFGGIVIRDDSDLEDRDIFLNYVNHADISHGGGKVFVNAVEDNYAPIHILDARPAVTFNTIQSSADMALLATPNSFDDSNGRIGPDISGNFLADNGIDALYVSIRTDGAQRVLDQMTVSGRFDDTDITHYIEENLIIEGSPGGAFFDTGTGVLTPRPAGRLMIDPGTVVKLDGATIQAERGAATLIAEGTVNEPIIFTSFADDRYGGSGDFDAQRTPGTTGTPGDWGGLIFSEGTHGSIDQAVIAFGGGDAEVSGVSGGISDFNAIEIHQAEVRVANSLITQNADGNASDNRRGIGNNTAATIYVRGAQPVIVGNQIVDNAGDAISINVNALRHEFMTDPGRQTGLSDAFSDLDANRGPLIRLNELSNNALNGLDIRSSNTPINPNNANHLDDYNVTTELVWDDTDIVHVVSGELAVGNLHTFGGIKLLSSVSESLVVKMDGGNSGFTATGTPLDIVDRVGGTLHVIGQPGYPVVLTDIDDDTVGAGFNPTGDVVLDTGNDGNTTGSPGSWSGLLFNEFSNDRNVALVTEVEPAFTQGNNLHAPLDGETRLRPEFLGELAPDMKSGDENRRLGFEVLGFIAPDAAEDFDVYSFTATGGTEVWLDIDQTASSLDAVVELVTIQDGLQARSTSPSSFVSGTVGVPGATTPQTLMQNVNRGGDTYTLNHKDPGMRVTLPGSGLGTYFVKVRSANGLTSGGYRLQVRMQQIDEFPGSTVRHADIRYATTAIDVQGLPVNSPLIGDAAEVGDAQAEFGGGQTLIDLLQSSTAAISVAGEIANATDVDVYEFDLTHIANTSGGPGTVALVFDLDYADEVSGLDATLAVFNGSNELVYIGRESNIESDRPAAGSADGRNLDDLSRGSVGDRDPYIGPVHLPVGDNYYVAVMSDQFLPSSAAVQFYGDGDNGTAGNARLTRLEPVNSVQRVVEDHIGFSGYTTSLDNAGTLANEEVRILPTTPAIFDISSAASLDTHIGSIEFNDLNLFVATDRTIGNNPQDLDELYIVNPNDGSQRQHLTDQNNADTLRAGNNDIQDITIRSDGAMFGYSRLDGNNNAVGQIVVIDPSTGEVGAATNDNVPGGNNVSAIAQNIGNRARRALQITQSEEVDALTFYRSGTDTNGIDSPEYDTFLVVRESDTSSKLYRGRESGDASPGLVNGNFVYGARGHIQPAGVTHETLFLNVVEPDADPANTERVTIRLEAREAGNGAQFTFEFEAPNNNATLDVFRDGPNAIRVALATNNTGVVTSTAAQIVDAINTATFNNGNIIAGDLVTALIYSGNANPQGEGDGAVVAEAFPGGLQFSSGGSDDLLNPPLAGRVTGIAFGDMFDTIGAGNTLYGVTAGGQFITIDPNSGVATVLATVAGANFTGLSLGPQNVQGGALANTLFALTDDDRVFAFDPSNPLAGDPATDNGQLAMPFGDGTAQSVNLAGLQSTPIGLAFSPFDFNLWHPTMLDATAAGHGVNDAPDNSRDSRTRRHAINGILSNNEDSVTEAEGGVSFYFGLENWDDTPTNNVDVDKYLNPDGLNAQFGVSPEIHRDLSSNPVIGENYNIPGGAKGSLQSSTFSLAGSAPEDRPVLYFNYFLETQDSAGADSDDSPADFVDSARVYVRSAETTEWQLVATNNQAFSSFSGNTFDAELNEHLSHLSNPTDLTSVGGNDKTRQTVQELHDNSNIWRQARIDMSTFAGETDIELRFDFSTSGTSSEGNLEGDQYANGNNNNEQLGTQNNANRGFFVDDIIVGFAERGEMVTNAPANTTANAFTDLGADRRTNFDATTLNRAPALNGDYQLEIRRTDLGDIHLNGIAGNIPNVIERNDVGAPAGIGGGDFALAYGDDSILIAQTFDTNVSHVLEAGNTNLLADENRVRPQGLFLVENNIISDSQVLGIHVQPGGLDGDGNGVSFPGPLQNFEREDNTNLIPGVVIQNNVIAGSDGIDFDGRANLDPRQSVPYGRILNNTFVGTGGNTGIDVNSNGSPIILNNVFTNLGTGIASGGADGGIEIENNLFHGPMGGNNGDNPITVGATAPLFHEGTADNARAARSFYLADGTLALDSSENAEERSLHSDFKIGLGIPPSPVLTPNRDALGQVRANSGGASGGTVDIGAVDRVDIDAPYASLLTPTDDESIVGPTTGVDSNPQPTIIQLDDPIVEAFSILLSDGKDPGSKFEGSGVDPRTVDSSSVLIRQNGRLLEEGEDFVLDFNQASGELRLTPISELWQPNSIYEIILVSEEQKSVRLEVNSGAEVADGDQIVVQQTLPGGGTETATVEFDSGYVLHLGDDASVFETGQSFAYTTDFDDDPDTYLDGYRARFRIEKLELTGEFGNLADEIFFDSNLDDDNLILEVVDESVFEVGDFIRINDEVMIVRGVGQAANEAGDTDNDFRDTIASTITVFRAALGTDEFAHRSRFVSTEAMSTPTVAAPTPVVLAADLGAPIPDLHPTGSKTEIEIQISGGDANLALELFPASVDVMSMTERTDYLAANPTFLQIGEEGGEVVRVVDSSGPDITIERAALGSARSAHPAIGAPALGVQPITLTKLSVQFADDIAILNAGQRAALNAELVDMPAGPNDPDFFNPSVLQGLNLAFNTDAGALNLIRVNDEIMRVDILPAGNPDTFQVERGYLGSKITEHPRGSVVEVLDTSREAEMAPIQNLVLPSIDPLTGDVNELDVFPDTFLASDHVLDFEITPLEFNPQVGDLLQIGTEIVRVREIPSDFAPLSLALERGMFGTEVQEHELDTPVRLIDSQFTNVILFGDDSVGDREVTAVDGTGQPQVVAGIGSKIAKALRTFRVNDPSGELDLRLPHAQSIEALDDGAGTIDHRVYLGGNPGDLFERDGGTELFFADGVAESDLLPADPGVSDGAIRVPFIPSIDFPESAIHAAVVSALRGATDLTDVQVTGDGSNGFSITSDAAAGLDDIQVSLATADGGVPSGFTVSAINSEPIRDLAGNVIRPNRGVSQTRFTIGVGELQYDLGDGATTVSEARHSLFGPDDIVGDPRLGRLQTPDGVASPFGMIVDTETSVTVSPAADADDNSGAAPGEVLTNSATSSATRLQFGSVASLAGLEGAFGVIGGEIVRILAVDAGNAQLVVLRGQLGTEATAHGQGSELEFVDDENGLAPTSVPQTFNVQRTMDVDGGPVQVTVFATDYGVVDGFIDLNDDGILTDDEQVIFAAAVWPGENTVDASFPAGTVLAGDSDVTMRLRISQSGVLLESGRAGGLTAGGEVEDHVVTLVAGNAPRFQGNLNAADDITTVDTYTMTESVPGMPSALVTAGVTSPDDYEPLFPAGSVDADGDAISVYQVIDLRTGRAYNVHPTQGAVIDQLTDSAGRVAGKLTVLASGDVRFEPRDHYDTGDLAGDDEIPGTADDVPVSLMFGYRVKDIDDVAGVETNIVEIVVENQNQVPTVDPISTMSDDGVDLTDLDEDDVDFHTVTITGISAGGDDQQFVQLSARAVNYIGNRADAMGNLIEADPGYEGLIQNLEIDGAFAEDGPVVEFGITSSEIGFDINPDQYGTAAIVVTVTDLGADGLEGGTGPDADLSYEETLFVTVNPVNDAPNAIDRLYEQAEASKFAAGDVEVPIEFRFTADDLITGDQATDANGDLLPVAVGANTDPATPGVDEFAIETPFNEIEQDFSVIAFQFANDAIIRYSDPVGGAVPTATFGALSVDANTRRLNFNDGAFANSTEIIVDFFTDNDLGENVRLENISEPVNPGDPTIVEQYEALANRGLLPTGRLTITRGSTADEFDTYVYTPTEDYNNDNAFMPDSFEYILQDDGISYSAVGDLAVDVPATQIGAADPIESPPRTVRFSVVPSGDTPVLGDFLDDLNINEDETNNAALTFTLDELFGAGNTSFLAGPGPDDSGAVPASWVQITDYQGTAGLFNNTGTNVPFTVNSDGSGNAVSITFNPTPDAFGQGSWEVQLVNPGTDGVGGVDFTSVTDRLTMTVNPVNDAPGAMDRVIEVNEDTTKIIAEVPANVLAGSTETPIDLIDDATEGTFAITPDALFDESSQDLRITSFNVNGTVVNVPSGDGEQRVNTAGHIPDPGGPGAGPGTGHITFKFTAGEFVGATYVPPTNVNFATPAVSTETFTYTVSDGGSTDYVDLGGATVSVPLVTTGAGGSDERLTDTGSVTLWVRDVNDPPIIPSELSDTQVFFEDQPTLTDGSISHDVIPTPGLRITPGPANEIAAGQVVNQPITVVETTATPLLDASKPLTLSTTGILRFTPLPHAYGTATLEVTVTDNSGDAATNTSTAIITLQIDSVNDQPIAFARSFNLNETVETSPTQTPDPLNITAAQLLDDGTDAVVPASDEVQNTFPEFDSVGGAQDTEIAQIIVPDSNGNRRVITETTTLLTVNGGTMQINFDAGGFNGANRFVDMVYTPDVNFNSSPSFNPSENFSYVARDNGEMPGNGDGLPHENLSDPAVVMITVTPANDLAILPVFDQTIDAGLATETTTVEFAERDTDDPTTLTIDLYANSSTLILPAPRSARDELVSQSPVIDIRLDTSASNTTGLMTGMPTLTTDGLFRVTPADNAFGTAVYEVRVFDTEFGTVPGSPSEADILGLAPRKITVNIAAVNDAPVANGIARTVAENASLTIPAGDFTMTASPSDLPTGPFDETVAPDTQSVRLVGIGLPSTVAGEDDPVTQLLSVENGLTELTDAKGTITVTYAGDGNSITNVEFEPAEDYNSLIDGNFIFTFFVEDFGGSADTNSVGNPGNLPSAPARAEITITDRNDLPQIPVLSDSMFAFDEGQAAPVVEASIFATATDRINAGDGVDEQSQTVTITVTPAAGQAGLAADIFSRDPVLSAAGRLEVFPIDDNVFGQVDYVITVRDFDAAGNQIDSVTENITVRVNPVNDAPLAADFTGNLTEYVEFVSVDSGNGLNQPVANPTAMSNGTGFLDISANDLLAGSQNGDFSTTPGAQFDESSQTPFVMGIGLPGDVDPVLSMADVVKSQFADPDNDGTSTYVWPTAIPTANGSLEVTFQFDNSDPQSMIEVGSIRYTPDTDYNSEQPFDANDQFTFFISDAGTDIPIPGTTELDPHDENNRSLPATVTLTVVAANDLPFIPVFDNEAVADTVTFTEGGTDLIQDIFSGTNQALAGNATSLDENAFSSVGFSLEIVSENGVPTTTSSLFVTAPTLDVGGSLQVDPVDNAFGTAVYKVTAVETDLAGNPLPNATLASRRVERLLTITINGVNDPPTAPSRVVALNEFVELENGTGNPKVTGGVDPQPDLTEGEGVFTISAQALLDGNINGTTGEGPALSSAADAGFETQTLRVTAIGLPGSGTPLVSEADFADTDYDASGLASVERDVANGTLLVTFFRNAATGDEYLESVRYTPSTDFNLDTPGTSPDRFTYTVRDSDLVNDESPDSLTASGMVTLEVNAANDVPTFNVDGDPVGDRQVNVELLERDDEQLTPFPNFVSNVSAGGVNAVDEQADQTVFFTYKGHLDSSSTLVPYNGVGSGYDSPLQSRVPRIINGTLFVATKVDAVGDELLVFDGEDSDGAFQRFTVTINVRPVNDPPELDGMLPIALTPNSSNETLATAGDDVFEVLSDGTIVYTVREDAIGYPGLNLIDPTGGGETFVIQPNQYLIQVPLGVRDPNNAAPSLLDPYTVGPANETSLPANQGGGQVLSATNIPTMSNQGGTLEPISTAGGELLYLLYTPPANVNSLNETIQDGFSYRVTDNGQSFNLETGALEADPKGRDVNVRFVLNPVNDAPTFSIRAGATVTRNEDAGTVSEDGFVFNILGGPTSDEQTNTAANRVRFENITLVDVSDPLDAAYSPFSQMTRDLPATTPAEMDAKRAAELAELSALYALAFDTEVSIAPAGRISFAAADDVFGDFVFTVNAVDGGAHDPFNPPGATGRGDVNQEQTSQMFTISIAPLNDPPQNNGTSDTVTLAATEDTQRNITAADIASVFAGGPMAPSIGTPGTDSFASLPSEAADVDVTLAGSATSQGGTITGDATAGFVYTPPTDFNRDFGLNESIGFTVFDAGSTTGGVSGTIAFDVAPVNDNPILPADLDVNRSESEGTPQGGGLLLHEVTGWLGGATGGPATAIDELGQVVFANNTTFAVVPADALNPTAFEQAIDNLGANGNDLGFTVPENVFGSAVIEFTAEDGSGGTTTTQFTINIGDVNLQPSFTAGNFVSVTEDAFSVTAYNAGFASDISAGSAFEDANQDVRFTVSVPAADQGLFAELPSIDAGGNLIFRTAQDAFGETTVTVTLEDDPDQDGVFAGDDDGTRFSDPLQLTIRINAQDDAPTAGDDTSFVTDEDAVLTFTTDDLLRNDSDVDNGIQFVGLSSNPAGPFNITPLILSNGAVVSISAGSNVISFNPRTSPALQSLAGPDDSGTPGDPSDDSIASENVTFYYQIADVTNSSVVASATVNILVQGENDAPAPTQGLTIPVAASGTTTIDFAELFDVIADDIDQGDSIDPDTITITVDEQFGEIDIVDVGGRTQLRYLPDETFLGRDSFSYTVEDSYGQVSQFVLVNLVSQPTAVPNSDGNLVSGTIRGGQVMLSVPDNFVSVTDLDLGSFQFQDAAGNPLTEVAGSPGTFITESGEGAVSYDSATGAITYTHTGTDTSVTEDLVRFVVSDSDGVESEQTVVAFNLVNNELANPINACDVNADGRVSALDALLVINRLNEQLGGSADSIVVATQTFDGFFYNTNDDARISAADALKIINDLVVQDQGGEQIEPAAGQIAPVVQSNSGLASQAAGQSDPVVLDAIESKLVGDESNADLSVLDVIAIDQTEARESGEDSGESALDEAIKNLF